MKEQGETRMQGRTRLETGERTPRRERLREGGAAGGSAGVCAGKCGGIGACAASTAHELAESLGRAVDARDSRLFRHSEVVADLSSMLARAHGLTTLQAQMVHMAGHLHDVGKIGIPDHILRKPGPLSAAEWEIMRRHPAIGAEILRPVRVFCGRPGVCEIVLAHHERFDGGGYPHGLRGAEIPLGARIVAVADAFSAMMTRSGGAVLTASTPVSPEQAARTSKPSPSRILPKLWRSWASSSTIRI